MQNSFLKTLKQITLCSSAFITFYSLNVEAATSKPKTNYSAAHKNTEVTLGGYVRTEAGFFSGNYQDNTKREFQAESEIHVKLKKTLDSGIEYGSTVQLKGSTDDRNASDETYIWTENKFGRIELGDRDGAADKMNASCPKIGFGQAFDGEFKDYLDSASRPQIGARAIDSEDSTKITYYTPRINSLQLGASYAPEFDEGESMNRSRQSQQTSTLLIDHIQPNRNSNRDPALDNSSRGNAERFFKKSFRDFVELGANYNGKIMDFDAVVTAGYIMAKPKSQSIDTAARHDFQSWQLGGNLKYRGFGVGGGYVDNGKSGQLKSRTKQDRHSVVFGVTYETGNWGYGANLIRENLGGTGIDGSGNYRAYGIGTAYKLAPGMMVAADFVTFRREFGSDPLNPNAKIVPSGLKADKSNDKGHVIVIGSRFDI